MAVSEPAAVHDKPQTVRSRSLRPLRAVPERLPDLPRTRRGDGFAARPHLPDGPGVGGPGGDQPRSTSSTSISASPAAHAKPRARRACNTAVWWKRRGLRSRPTSSARGTYNCCGSLSSSGFCPRAPPCGLAGSALYAYQASGLQSLVRGSGLLKLMGKMGRIEELAPSAEMPRSTAGTDRFCPPSESAVTASRSSAAAWRMCFSRG